MLDIAASGRSRHGAGWRCLKLRHPQASEQEERCRPSVFRRRGGGNPGSADRGCRRAAAQVLCPPGRKSIPWQAEKPGKLGNLASCEPGKLETWQAGTWQAGNLASCEPDLASWKPGKLETWQAGNLASWKPDKLETWQAVNLASWEPGKLESLASWKAWQAGNLASSISR
jgi:hypothetical protein